MQRRRGPAPGSGQREREVRDRVVAKPWLTRLTALLAAGLLVVACGEGGPPAGDTAPDTEEATAGEAASEAPEETAETPELDPSVLEDTTRPEEEVAEDEGRKPLQLYEFLGIRPGLTVADVFPGAGYNTHLLSRVVGEDGKVYSVLGFYDDRELFDGNLYRRPVIEERIQDANLDNVELVSGLEQLPDAGVDVMISVRNYHDVDWVFEGWSREDTVAEIYRALVPGGVVGIVEVDTDEPGWNQDTHRLHRDVVIEDFTGGGFVLADTSEMLDNPEDDHGTSGFETGRHLTDRYVLKFRKPEEETEATGTDRAEPAAGGTEPAGSAREESP